MELAEVIEILKARRSVVTGESAAFSRLTLQLLAEGKPVTPERLAEASGEPIEMIRANFTAMRKGGCEFNDQGALMGNALTLTPTSHRFRVNGHDLYAWCALDTLFLPALIGRTADVESTCPVTGRQITLTVTPEKITACDPPQVALSIVTGECCIPGPQGDFCGQIFFFASPEVAAAWVGGRSGLAILSAADAFTLAHAVYVDIGLSSGETEV